jgi:hypothetical protein
MLGGMTCHGRLHLRGEDIRLRRPPGRMSSLFALPSQARPINQARRQRRQPERTNSTYQARGENIDRRSYPATVSINVADTGP